MTLTIAIFTKKLLKLLHDLYPSRNDSVTNRQSYMFLLESYRASKGKSPKYVNYNTDGSPIWLIDYENPLP